MKKTIAAVTVIVVLGLAGVAVAERHRDDGRWRRDGDGACRMGQRGDMDMGRHDGDRSSGYRQGREDRDYMRHGGMDRMGGQAGCDMMGMGGMSKNVPDDVRAKMVELAKLKIDMRDALTRNPVDRAKATEVHGKMAALRQEIGAWRFNQRLDDIERRQKEMELNRKVPMGMSSPMSSGDAAPRTH